MKVYNIVCVFYYYYISDKKKSWKCVLFLSLPFLFSFPCRSPETRVVLGRIPPSHPRVEQEQHRLFEITKKCNYTSFTFTIMFTSFTTNNTTRTSRLLAYFLYYTSTILITYAREGETTPPLLLSLLLLYYSRIIKILMRSPPLVRTPPALDSATILRYYNNFVVAFVLMFQYINKFQQRSKTTKVYI